jgi:nucleoside-diphosphate-sugar epimerase
MNVLITGGTDFIGSALCRRLLEDKHVVTVLTRHPDTIKAPPPLKASFSLSN